MIRSAECKGVIYDLARGDHNSMALFYGIDIGGSHVSAGLVTAEGRLLARAAAPLPPRPPVETVVAVVRRLLAQMAPAGGVRRAGVGVASAVDLDGRARFAPNLGWHDVPLRGLLEDALGMDVGVFNDADCAAFAEAKVGAGRAARYLVLLTLGTGIGGGIVLDGRPYLGAGGLGAEIGHMKIVDDGPLCGCGRHGCLEALAGGLAIRARAARLLEERPDLAARSSLSTDFDVKAIFDAARAGDPLAEEVVAETARYLGVAVANIINILDPEVVVLGGSIASAGEVLWAPVREEAAQGTMGGPRPYVRVVPAVLGPDAGLVGAALLASAVYF